MTTFIRTTCMLDCPDACGMIVEVRDGKAVRITGNPSHPTGHP